MNLRLISTFVFIFIFLSRCIESLLPYDHSDALYYHLAGAKIWYFESFKHLILNLPSYAQAGMFDLFYYPLFFLHLSLVKTQSLAQFLHFFCSIGLAAIFCLSTGRKSLWSVLAALSMLTIAKDGSYFVFAKNDGVLALMGLFLCYSVVERKPWWLIAILMGSLPLIKLSGIYVVIPTSLLYVYLNRNFKDVIRVASISVLMLSLALLKNYFITGNPFFPGATNHFRGLLSQSMIDYNLGFFGNGVTLNTFKGLLTDLFLGKIILLFSIPVFFYNLKRKNFSPNFYFLTAITIFSIYLITNGGYQAARFFFSCHFLLIYFLFVSLKHLELNPLWMTLILLLILADAKVDKSVKRAWFAIRDYATLSDSQIVLKHIPHTHFWQFLPKANEPKLILTDYVSESYYLPPQYTLHIPDHSPQADFLYHCEGNNINELNRYQFALLMKNLANPCYEKIRKGKLLTSKNGFELFELP
jgi:hypothetical protein